MPRGLKIQQLRYAVLVHELGSFQAAANRLHRSQPAISLGIRELEAQLDAPIFEKKRQGKLTAFGQVFLPKFQELVGLHDRLNKEIDDVIHSAQGGLRWQRYPLSHDASCLVFSTNSLSNIRISRSDYTMVLLNLLQKWSDQAR